MLVSFWSSITTSVPILQLPASNSSEEPMCQQEPSASVAIPPLLIAISVVFLDAMSASAYFPLTDCVSDNPPIAVVLDRNPIGSGRRFGGVRIAG
jgi:hypothetical protein